MNTDSQSQSELPETDSFVALLNTSNAGSSEGLQNPNAAVYNSDVIFSAHDSPEFGNDVGLLHGSGASEPDHGGSFQGLETFAKASSSVDAPAARADYNKALFEARMSTIGDAAMKMPWETGIMKQIFDSDDDSVFPTVVPPVPAEYFAIPPGTVDEQTGQGSAADVPTAQSLVRDDIALPYYSFAVKVLPDRDIFAEDTVLWDKALQKWLQVFEVLGFPGTLGFSLLAEQAYGATGAQSDALRDALGIKSPRTAVKRAQTLLRYFAWLGRLGTLGPFLVLEISGFSWLTWGAGIKGHNAVGGAQIFEVCAGSANSRGPDFGSSVERQSATSHGFQIILQTCEASQGQGIGCTGKSHGFRFGCERPLHVGCNNFCGAVQVQVVGSEVCGSVLGGACRVQWTTFWVCRS